MATHYLSVVDTLAVSDKTLAVNAKSLVVNAKTLVVSASSYPGVLVHLNYPPIGTLLITFLKNSLNV